jgi:bifunctional DNase/RNase
MIDEGRLQELSSVPAIIAFIRPRYRKEDDMLHKMAVESLAVDPESNSPIIVLKSLADGRNLMIWIGALEATSIVYAIQGVPFERPLTHDLFKNFLERTAFTITKIVICDIENNTFYAKIFFESGDSEFFMDARPSDAIAMAIRFGSMIYAEEAVITKSRQDTRKAEMADDSEEGKKWAEYLETLTNDDFGKYKV